MFTSRDNEALYAYMAEAREVYDQAMLKRVCEMHEDDFGEAFGLTVIPVTQKWPNDFYYYKDNGSSILAVGHLDTVCDHEEREAFFTDTQAGEVIHAGGLDDRLGVYVILDMLPKLGLNYDLLLTVGEESGLSTAGFFQPPKGKEYDWIIEFDRGGSDVVMYQYEDNEVKEMVRETGARVSVGSYSDIAYMEHLGIKAFNWGAGYQGDYHSIRGFAFLEDTFEMVAYYLIFHELYEGTYMPHYRKDGAWPWRRPGWWETDDDEDVAVASRFVPGDDDEDALNRHYLDDDETDLAGRYNPMWDDIVIDPDEDEEDWDENPSMEKINAALAALDEAR